MLRNEGADASRLAQVGAAKELRILLRRLAGALTADPAEAGAFPARYLAAFEADVYEPQRVTWPAACETYDSEMAMIRDVVGHDYWQHLITA
jgi:hypothetical protein